MAFPDLGVWMNGQRVGTWFWLRTGTPGFRYEDSWLHSPNTRALSLSLPLPAAGGDITGAKVENYFDNLLPDSARIRERLRRRFGASSTRAADLLAAIGRDCVGAVQLLLDGDAPAPHNRVESEPLTDSQVARMLSQVTEDDLEPTSPLANFRISIAGAQEKTALLHMGGRWHLPHGSTPTTHIFKLPIGLVGGMRADMSQSVENEWLCHTMLGLMGFDVAETQMGLFEDQKVLVVERFDRRWTDGNDWLVRLPQEDFCQATGTAAGKKYESDGGPGHRACLALLSGSSQARADSLTFVKSQLAFWLMAATDGHAKNFSIFLERGGGYRLTPLYDVLSAWPIIGKGPNMLNPSRAKLSMALRSKNTHDNLHEVRTRHWELLAKQSGVPGAFDQMVAMVLQVPQVLKNVEELLPAGFPRQVFTSIRRGMRAQAELFVQGME